MKLEQTEMQTTTFFGRIRAAFSTPGISDDERGRVRRVLGSLALHLHPTRVPKRSLSLTYTWGLGGLSAMLVVILAITGIMLTKNYTPSPTQAYYDILNLRTNVWFGELLRNLHHWAANLLILTAALHLLRVFFTGAYRGRRAQNWMVGLLLLLLAIVGNFTGYLLPWDQLAYWAVTVATSVVSYVPFVGGWISRMLLGGPEISAATLLNFYSIHIGVIPLFFVVMLSYHFWRVRKDGNLSVPRRPDEQLEEKMEKVTTIPNLVHRELVFALVWLALLIGWSMAVPAPLEEIANPMVSPNPAKAAWYFLGLQELLLHFHPLIGAVVIPGTALGLMALLPFFDYDEQNVGVYFRSRRGRLLALLAVLLAFFVTPIWILLDEYVLTWSAWLPNLPSLVTTGLVPLALVAVWFLMMDEILVRIFKSTPEERVLFLFTFVVGAFLVLTITGIFFRGPGMGLFLPWDMPVVPH